MNITIPTPSSTCYGLTADAFKTILSLFKVNCKVQAGASYGEYNETYNYYIFSILPSGGFTEEVDDFREAKETLKQKTKASILALGRQQGWEISVLFPYSLEFDGRHNPSGFIIKVDA